jgi:hypothetical protein
MRLFVSLAAICMLACTQLAFAQSTSSAPADEYFGRMNASVLEIRNRLNDFDTRSDAQMIEPGVITRIDDLAQAMLDWQRKYPNDPWLPRSFAQLLRDYHRAGAASTPEAMNALAVMRTAYPDAPETSATVALLFAGGEDLAANDPPPGPTMVAAQAQAATSVPSNAWARFEALRYGAPSNP